MFPKMLKLRDSPASVLYTAQAYIIGFAYFTWFLEGKYHFKPYSSTLKGNSEEYFKNLIAFCYM